MGSMDSIARFLILRDSLSLSCLFSQRVQERLNRGREGGKAQAAPLLRRGRSTCRQVVQDQGQALYIVCGQERIAGLFVGRAVGFRAVEVVGVAGIEGERQAVAEID